jgi:hypothetical protein
VFNLASSTALDRFGRQAQQFGGVYSQHLGDTTDDPQTCVESALFQLAQIASAHTGLVSQVVLRHAPCIAKTAQISGKYISQIHARSEANCSKYTPRYIEQSDEFWDTLISGPWCRGRTTGGHCCLTAWTEPGRENQLALKSIQLLGGDWPAGKAEVRTAPFTKKLDRLVMPGPLFSRESVLAADVVSVEPIHESTQVVTTSKQKGMGQLGAMAVGGLALGGVGLLAGGAFGRNKRVSVSDSKSKISAVVRFSGDRQAFVEGDYEVLKLIIAATFDKQSVSRNTGSGTSTKTEYQPTAVTQERKPAQPTDGSAWTKARQRIAARRKNAVPLPKGLATVIGLLFLGSP